MSAYIVCVMTEDGLVLSQLTERELTTRLNERYYGPDTTFLAEIPKRELNIYEVVIIKGHIVQPKAVQTVTEYALD